MVRVSDMQIQPDKNRYRLDGWMNLTASYQKDPKTFGTQPTASEAKAKTEPATSEAKTKTAPAASEAKPAEAKPETKPSGGKRTVPKRTIPTRPVRKTQ